MFVQVKSESFGERSFLHGVMVFVLASGLGVLPGSALSMDATATASTNDGELEALLDLLDEQTELATKSRLNADYVPGMMTVLSGDELIARGARTVWEALALVPGISQGIEPTGERQVLTRGFGHGYASGNIKILLDDVSMNSALLATANPVMNMPIEQVDRIEVIRGPGSSVYGEFAYAGVVNVITRRGQRSVYGLAGSGDTYGGGGLWNWQDEARDLSVSLNVVGLSGNGPDAHVDQDGLYEEGLEDLSNAPGYTNEAHQYSGVFFDVTWGDYFASVKVMDDGYGDHFGINHYLPPHDEHLSSWQREKSIVVGRNLAFSDSLDGRVRLEYLRHDRERDRLYVLPSYFLDDWQTDPLFMNLDYEETRLLGQAEFHWRPNPRHEVLFIVEGSETEVDDSTWNWWAGDIDFDYGEYWLDPDLSRTNVNVVVQDQFKVTDDVTLTATLRYDHYDDLDDTFSPRLAAVWRIDQQNILKFQYARAFRPPTFYEVQYWALDAYTGEPTGQPLESGRIDTYEIGYILKRPQWEGRLTAFYSEMDGPIAYVNTPTIYGYVNDEDARMQGIELEYQQRLGRHFKVDANLSYVDAERTSTGKPLPGGTDWLANAALLWQPDQRWTGTIQMHYVGERAREEQDYRGPMDAYTVFDLTLGYRSPTNGFKAWAGIKNLTDEDVRFPNQDAADDEGGYLPYPDDYPRPGRTWWMSVGYDF